MRGALPCLLLLAACSEPLIAVVGVEGDARTGADGGRTRAPEPDADSSGDRDADADSNDAHVVEEHCVLLPNVVAAGLLGEVLGPEVRTQGFTQGGQNQCPTADPDAGVITFYLFGRLDGEPIVRGGHRYALSWPPEGKTPDPLFALRGPLSAVREPCAGGPTVAELNRGGGSRDCVELKPGKDARYLSLATPVLLGIGTAEFVLCPGACSP